MNRLPYFVVLLFMYLNFCPCVNTAFAPNYAYIIDSAGQAFEGYINSQSRAGDKVRVKRMEDKEFIENDMGVTYLQVVIRKIDRPKNGTVLIAVDTEAFVVDGDGYIVINNTEIFESAIEVGAELEFYVVMIADDDVVSNPVPFIVRAEKPVAESSTYSEAAAVFAGVLVCLIVIFALLIPFVVRAKRRLRSGKPVFKLGSHAESTANLPKAVGNEKGSQTQLATDMVVDHKPYIHPHAHLFTRTLTEGDFYDNRGFRLEETFEREQNELSKDLLEIAKNVKEPTNGIFIHLEKQHSSDSDSGVSSDSRGKNTQKSGETPAICTLEMNKKTISTKQKPKRKEETSRL